MWGWLTSLTSFGTAHGLQTQTANPQPAKANYTSTGGHQDTVVRSADSPVGICSAISLSQWLPDPLKSAAPEGLTAYEVEQTERSAFESFLQGYSLL